MGGVKAMKFLRFVAGAACAPAERVSFERMRQVAERICAAHESEPADAVLLSEEEYRWDDVELSGARPERLVSQPLEAARLMSEEDKDVALDCLRIMLRAESADASVDAVLARLGQYFRADRVYILILGEQGQTVTMLNEWVKKGKHSIQQNISGKRVSRFPVIARYADATAPVVLSMRQPPDERAAGGEVSWQYAIFPMEKLNGAGQLLCIENPRRSIERTALLTELLPYLSRERVRRGGVQEAVSPLDRLYALPNQQAYMDAAYAMDSDRYRSDGRYTRQVYTDVCFAGRGRHGRGGKHSLPHSAEEKHHLSFRQAVFARLRAGSAQPSHRHIPEFPGRGEKGARHRRDPLRHWLGRHGRRQDHQGKRRPHHRAGAGHGQV